jgi:hypothetical protein
VSPTCRVWVRGGLGNQLASLCAGFVAVQRQHGTISKLIVDASAINARTNPSRSYQLQNFVIYDSSNRVTIEEKFPSTEISRKLMSAKRRGLQHLSGRPVTRSRGVWYPSVDVYYEALKEHPRWLDGHFEVGSLALEAKQLGLSFPLRLRRQSAEFDNAVDGDFSHEIGVHIRLGDFQTWVGGHYLLDANYYRNALFALGEKPNSARVCIFSDDKEGAVSLLKEVGVPLENMRISNLANPAEDLVRFSLFRRKVLSHSTFAWWAGFFGDYGECVYPDPISAMDPLMSWTPVEW